MRRFPEITLLHGALGLMGAIAVDELTGGALSRLGAAEESGEPVKAVQTLVLLALSVGLSILAGYLLERDRKNPLQDERPTALASRGSYIAWCSGVRRLGYTLVWAGDRATRKERPPGGKGDLFSGPKQTVYIENGMHVIGVGPFDALRSIEQAGEVIFEGPITPDSHPSGTLIDLGGEGSFRIFWGEDDQPVNMFMGDSSRIGVESRWPNFCYIEWRSKRLGTSPQWPIMSYVMEKRPTGNHLSDTDPWIEPTRTLTGPTFGSFHAVDAVANTITLSQADGDVTDQIRPLDLVRLTGNALSDQDLNVLSVEVTALTTSFGTYVRIDGFRTTITFAEDLTGIDTAGTIQAYEGDIGGANAAHAIADMLFEKWPQGLSLSESDWDMDSLEDMGTDTLAEDLRTSWVAQEAATAEARLGAGLQDLGYMVPIDPATGLVKFQPVRAPSGTLANLDSKMIVDVLPELDKLLGERPVDFMVFGFPNQDINFRDMTIGRMEDGQISLLEVARARSVPLTITTYYPTAATIANRRTQEEMAQNAAWDIRTNRATREWIPGQAVTANFTDEVLRVIEVEPVPDSNKVNLKLLLDSYGLEAQDFTDTSPDIVGTLKPAQQDVAFAFVEVPEYLNGVPPQTALIPRIRAHEQIDDAALHLSADNVTYTQVDSSTVHNPGGTLTTALAADDPYEPADGVVQFTTLGPDIGEALDLTGDDVNWRLGRQLAILVSAAGTEICFVKKVTVVSGSTYSLDGLIRARYDTRRLAHPANATQVFLVDTQSVSPVQDPLLSPEVTRYVKTQPTGNGVVGLSAVPAISRALYGKGIRPPIVSALRVTSPNLVDAYTTGEDVTLEWAYPTPRTPGTSAGLQAAGQAVGTTSPEGEFELEILTIGDVLVRTESVSSASYTYTNANLVSDLGSEVSFKVRVKQLRDGYESDPVTITVEKV